MGKTGYNPRYGQVIKDDAGGNQDWDFLAHYTIAAADADAASATYILASTVLGAAPSTVLAAALAAQPPTPRVLTIKGNQAGVAGNVVITGTDFAGAALTDTIAANGAAEVIGAKAFKTIVSIALPALVGAGDEISIGISDKFGIPFKLPYAAAVIAIVNNGTATTVAATSSFSATVLADNFIDPTAALAGTQVDVYMIV
jgi:hypothetical protein